VVFVTVRLAVTKACCRLPQSAPVLRASIDFPLDRLFKQEPSRKGRPSVELRIECGDTAGQLTLDQLTFGASNSGKPILRDPSYLAVKPNQSTLNSVLLCWLAHTTSAKKALCSRIEYRTSLWEGTDMSCRSPASSLELP
jgi:hypothetical protein